ncbi:hypothetical protein [Nonomuraea zeae]|uniref:DUF4404 family protein n=1 Tax=Nonomuraea zeae TaxID=1642303 RepID=A0A5S4G0N9_9ACTN|nr:hypothetical protein [Nonomuraea zeae]TMR18077.1 hypothetical protein ETD85_53795 [Nonomuraea zeae]
MGTEYGVHISGGDVSGPIAMGEHARATVYNVGGAGDTGELGRLLDRLERLLGEHEAELAEPQRAHRDAADVRQELAEAEPDRSRIMDALKRLSVRAAEVSVIVEVVSQIRDLLP